MMHCKGVLGTAALFVVLYMGGLAFEMGDVFFDMEREERILYEARFRVSFLAWYMVLPISLCGSLF